MPYKNIYKDYIEDSYYHVFNRGVAKQPIFLDNQDYSVFLSLLKRYLGDQPEKDSNGQYLSCYVGRIELLAFCLMQNHFHLFIYQKDANAMKDFMKSLAVSYSMYFNKRYKRVGPLFQQRYKAVRITNDSHLLHITRYIHLNPPSYQGYEWSSYRYYIGQKNAVWLNPDRVLSLFDGDYANFVAEYVDKKAELEQIKEELADG